MLFLTKEMGAEVARILRQLEAGTMGDAEAGERLTQIDPDSAVGYLILGNLRFHAGDLEEAETLYWKAIDRKPCDYYPYLSLVNLRLALHPADPLAVCLSELAYWKLSFLDEIPDRAVRIFGAQFPELDCHDPKTYGRLARESEAAPLEESPELTDRLLPYRLLNDLQRHAPIAVTFTLLRQILHAGARCLPLFRSAMRSWGRRRGDITDEALALIVALAGEIGDTELIEDMIELGSFHHQLTFLHSHWAIWRIGQRYPREAIAKLRAAIPSAKVGRRCAIAEQLCLMLSEPDAGPALLDLLRDFRLFAQDGDAVYLVGIVVHALLSIHLSADAARALERVEPMLPKESRNILEGWLTDESSFVPMLVERKIDRLTIEDVCISRKLMVEPEDEDVEADSQKPWLDSVRTGSRDDNDEPPERRHVPPKPGRNDPCWCGSGKKYKKCHLEEDEAGERPSR